MKAAAPSVRWAIAAIVALAAGVGGYVAFNAFVAAPKAPHVVYTLLDGSRTNTEQLRGKVVLVNFWSTDCSSCLHEMPQIIATHEKFKARGYDTLAVSMEYDPPAEVIRFAAERKLPFGVAIDNTGEIAQRFGNVKLTPTSVLINRRGEIVERYVGEPDFAALHRQVEKLLAES